MPTNFNAVNCKKELLGTGFVDCEIIFGSIKSVLRVSNDWVFNPLTDTFNFEYVVSKVQDGTFVPFLNTLEFLNNTPEATTKEYQGGAMAVIRNGKPQYSLEYNNGWGFHSASYSYNGFRSGSVILIDKSGNVGLLRNVSETQLSGFLTNMFNTSTWVPPVGDDTAKTLLAFQIDNEEAFNKRFTIISAEEIGADLNEDLRGVVSVNINGTASVAAGININVTAYNNKSFGILALDETNFRVRNTTTNTVLAIDTVTNGPVPGNYIITTTPTLVSANTIVVETYDATATPPTNTAILGTNQLFRGASAAITVTT